MAETCINTGSVLTMLVCLTILSHFAAVRITEVRRADLIFFFILLDKTDIDKANMSVKV